MAFRRGLVALIIFSLAGFTSYLRGQSKVLKYSHLIDSIVCYAAPGHSDLRIGPPEAYLSRLKSSAAVNAEINITLDNNRISFSGGCLIFKDADDISIEDYLYAPEFNVLIPGKVVTVSFKEKLESKFLFK